MHPINTLKLIFPFCLGEYQVPVESLVEPPEELKLREIDEEFVAKIAKAYNPQLGFGYNVFPVLVDGEFDADHPERATLQTLGGNHLRCAYQALIKGKQLQNAHKKVTVKVYRYVMILLSI